LKAIETMKNVLSNFTSSLALVFMLLVVCIFMGNYLSPLSNALTHEPGFFEKLGVSEGPSIVEPLFSVFILLLIAAILFRTLSKQISKPKLAQMETFPKPRKLKKTPAPKE